MWHPTQYANMNGLHSVSSGTPLMVEVAMRLGWLYERMLPWGLVEGLRCVEAACAPLSGAPIEPIPFARVFLAHTIKWPPLVRRWVGATADSRTATDLVKAYTDIAAR